MLNAHQNSHEAPPLQYCNHMSACSVQCWIGTKSREMTLIVVCTYRHTYVSAHTCTHTQSDYCFLETHVNSSLPAFKGRNDPATSLSLEGACILSSVLHSTSPLCTWSGPPVLTHNQHRHWGTWVSTHLVVHFFSTRLSLGRKNIETFSFTLRLVCLNMCTVGHVYVCIHVCLPLHA